MLSCKGFQLLTKSVQLSAHLRRGEGRKEGREEGRREEGRREEGRKEGRKEGGRKEGGGVQERGEVWNRNDDMLGSILLAREKL